MADEIEGPSRERLNARFAAAINAVSDVFYAVDHAWRIVAFNDAAERYFPFGADAVLGKTLWELFPQGRGTPFGDALERAMAKRESTSMRTESSLTPGRSIEVRIAPWDDGVCVAIDDQTEREAAQRRERESEDRLRLATEGAGIGAYELDLETGEGFWSPSAFRLVGIEPTLDLRGTFEMWRKTIHPDDLDRVQREHREAAARGGAWRTEYRIVRVNDGQTRWVATYGQFIPKADGGARSIGVASDITERKLAEEDLRESEERFRSLYNSIEAGFYIAELRDDGGEVDYRYIETNPALARITGLVGVEGKWRREVTQGQPEQFWFDLFARVVRTQTGERVEHLHEGLGLWMDVHAYPVGAPEERRFAVLFNDITERKRLEFEREERAAAFRAELEAAVATRTAELQRSEARLRAIFETSHMHQGLLSPDGRLLYTNATALNDVGATLVDVVGRKFWETLWFVGTEGAPDFVRDAVTRAAGGETVTSTLTLNLPAGRKHFDFSMRPVRDNAGAIAHLLPEAIDITARVEAESALRQAQKLEAMGQLTGGVAHDFNNLLMIMSGGLNMLERKDEPARREMLIGRMREAVERGAKLTQQLLAFSRKHDLAPQTLDFGARVEAMRELLDRSLGGQVRVAVDVAPNLTPIYVDPAGLQHALVNLAVNARDAMPEGGVITIKAVNGAPGDPRAPSVSISVIDTGIGMSTEVLARIFEPFFTTKDIGKGSGLGLAQVHGFAQQSGGRVEVQSAPGKGATMTLVLPRGEGREAESEIVVPHAQTSIAKAAGQALLVEDDDDVAALTTEMLADLGWRVTRAASGEAALALLAARADIDFVFSDVMMPGGMNGLEMSRRARERNPRLRILLTSGYAAPVAQEATRAGLPLLPKPFTIEALANAVAKATTSARQSD